MEMLGIDAYLAQTKDKHISARQPGPRGRIPKNAGPGERMGRKVRTKKGRKVYCGASTWSSR